MKISGIYKLVSPSNKVYIGQSYDIERRFKEHKRVQCKTQRKLYYALLKYGSENFKYEILYELPKDKIKDTDLLNDLEFHFINLYNSIANGYNLQQGGKNGRISEEALVRKREIMKNSIKAIEQRKKLHESFKGKSRSQETKNKIADSNKGKTMSKESIAKRLLTMSLKNYPSRRKKIFQYDLEGNFIKEWESCLEISKLYNCKRGSVTEACSKNKKLKGYFWKYLKI